MRLEGQKREARRFSQVEKEAEKELLVMLGEAENAGDKVGASGVDCTERCLRSKTPCVGRRRSEERIARTLIHLFLHRSIIVLSLHVVRVFSIDECVPSNCVINIDHHISNLSAFGEKGQEV